MEVQAAMPIMLDVLSGAVPTIAVSLHSHSAHQRWPQSGEITSAIETDTALRDLAQALASFEIALKFSKDEETGAIVVQMINQQSGETLQQIPSKARLHVAATLSKLQGRILNRRA